MRKTKLRRITVTILAAIILGAATFGLALSIKEKFFGGVFAYWEPLGMPPASFGRFLGVTSCRFVQTEVDGRAILYIESSDNRVYKYDMCAAEGEWRETEKPDYLSGFFAKCNTPAALTQAPDLGRLPDKVTDCVEETWSWEVVRDTTYFVRLENQTIWWWRAYMSLATNIGFVCGLPFVVAIAGAVGLNYIWRTKYHQAEKFIP